jgi:hypothetical protein
VKPENRFIASINRRLPIKSSRESAKARERYPTSCWIHYEKTCNPFRGGTADAWYSGNADSIWIEYKYLPAHPRQPLDLSVRYLSALQVDWLNGRLEEGRNVAVIAGVPKGAVILTDGAWVKMQSPEEFCRKILSLDDTARWIFDQVCRERG